MNATKHYDAAYLGNTGKALDKLKENSYNFFSDKEDACIIDLGCGTGYDVKRMASRKPDCRFVGIDHDENLLQIARDNLELTNLKFIKADATEIPLDDRSVDGIRAERLFQHLPKEEQTWTEITRIARPECRILIIETDWSSLTMYTGLKQLENEVVQYLTEAKVNNGLAANDLLYLFQERGVKDLKMEVTPNVIYGLHQANMLIKLEEMVNEAARKGFVSSESSEHLFDRMRTLDDQGVFACTLNMVTVSGIIE